MANAPIQWWMEAKYYLLPVITAKTQAMISYGVCVLYVHALTLLVCGQVLFSTISTRANVRHIQMMVPEDMSRWRSVTP